MPDSFQDTLKKLSELEEVDVKTIEAFCVAVTRVMNQCSETLVAMRTLFPKVKKTS